MLATRRASTRRIDLRTPPRGELSAFTLPPELEAAAPPEARGLARDAVRLMVSRAQDDRIEHARFRDLSAFLEPGDLLVINTSGTRPAALPALRADGSRLWLHLSTQLPGGRWSIELRQDADKGSRPFLGAGAGEAFDLPGGARLTLIEPYRRPSAPVLGGIRLWLARLEGIAGAAGGGDIDAYLARYGTPIRYRYVDRPWPIACYQTVYATEPGSAEMPSAGRAFTPELITRLVAAGIGLAPLVLHTGVASLETGEPPYPEYYRVRAATAERVNAARAAGHRVIAVGTTVVRALETVAGPDGLARAGEGWTETVITPDRSLKLVDGLLTGFHAPGASHLAMLEALAGPRHVRLAYAAALAGRYLWHEFGDLHVILP